MWLSIKGMYDYNPRIFDELKVPEYTDASGNRHILNKDALISNIMLQCAEMELVYPSIPIMKYAIGVWSESNQRSWEKLYASMFLEYNPIWNVDADETETETNARDINRKHSGSNNEIRNLTDEETRNLTDSETRNMTDTETKNLTDAELVNLTDTESVQGFNSASWTDAKKLAKSGTDTFNHTGTDTTTMTGTDTFNHTGSDTVRHTGTDNIAISNNETVNDDNERILTKRRTGNIGVTASQDLIKKEREIADFSIIEYITQSFKERFCLLIY